MDVIRISGLEVWARHGVLPEEQQRGQLFRLDIALAIDLGPASTSDELADTVDYGMLSQRVHDAVATSRYDLIERVAADVLTLCLEDERVQAAEVTVHKPSAPLPVPADEVSVTLRRER